MRTSDSEHGLVNDGDDKRRESQDLLVKRRSNRDCQPIAGQTNRLLRKAPELRCASLG